MSGLVDGQGIANRKQGTAQCQIGMAAVLVPDLVILNLLFDQADQVWQFLERLKADPATAVTPVLVCATDVALLERVADRLAT